MKIKSIYISSFGLLEDFKLDFTDGFNTVYGSNEHGKSTIMAFIKMMFYGSKGGTKLKNPRNKYLSWSGKASAGSITFQHNGKNYRLEREFKSSNSTDKVTLIDLDLGTQTSVSADVGIEFFGLSQSAFERSIFIGSLTNEKNDSEAEGEINAKLSNMNTSGDEDISFTKVLSRLEKALGRLTSKKGTAGEMDKNLVKLKKLEDEHSAALNKRSHIENLKKDAQTLALEIAELDKKSEQLREKLIFAERSKNTEKIKELLSLKSELDSLRQSLILKDGKYVDEIFVRTISFGIGKIDNLNQKLSLKRSEEEMLQKNIDLLENPSEDMTEKTAEKISIQIAELNQKSEQIDALIQDKKSNTRQNGKKPFNTPLLIIGILLTLASILLGVAKLFTAAIPSLITAIVVLVLAFIIKSPSKSFNENELNEQTALKENIKAQIMQLESKRETILAVINSNASVLDNQKKALFECKEEILGLISSINTETEKLGEFYSRYKDSDTLEEIKRELEHLDELCSKQKLIKQQLNYIAKDLNNISYEEAESILNSQDNALPLDETADELNTQFQALSELLSNKKSVYSSLITEIKLSEKNSVNPDLINSQIQSLRETTASQNEFCEETRIAIDVLTQSFAELRRSYGSVLEKNATEIFSALTLNQYSNMGISKSFDIGVEKSGVFGQKEIDYLSAGTADQAYLSMRLALTRLIEAEETLPVFLDDALMQYDDTRTQIATDYINEFAKDSQVIMFTCHGFVANCAEKSGSFVTNI